MTVVPSEPARPLRILGIDPGTRTLGYGVLGVGGRAREPEVVARGAIRLPSRPLAARLEIIFRELGRLIAVHRPLVLAIEEVFHGKNFQSVLKLGEARGVAILAAQVAGLDVREYPPALIKKAATGNGNATKAQVGAMMERILGVKTPLGSADEADALAAAYCHSTRLWRTALPAAPPSRRRRAFPPILPGQTFPPILPRRAAQPASARAAKSAVPASGARKPVAASAVADLLRSGAARVFRGARFRKPARRKGGRDERG
jgi:crossover junction endodeoxyribonuclease RuvC